MTRGDKMKQERFYTIKIFECGSRGMPNDVHAEITGLWDFFELDNDDYFRGDLQDLREMTHNFFHNGNDLDFGINMTETIKWIEEAGLENEEVFLIHDWW